MSHSHCACAASTAHAPLAYGLALHCTTNQGYNQGKDQGKDHGKERKGQGNKRRFKEQKRGSMKERPIEGRKGTGEGKIGQS